MGPYARWSPGLSNGILLSHVELENGKMNAAAHAPLAGLSLKVKAQRQGKTPYAVQDDLLSDYLRVELRPSFTGA